MTATNPDLFNDTHANNFLFTCNRTPDTSFRVVDVVIPGFALAVTALPTFKIIEQLPGAVWTPDDFVVTFIIDERWKNYFEIMNWWLQIKKTDEEQLASMLAEIGLIITDNHGRGLVSFQYEGAFPSAVNAIAMGSNVGIPNALLCTVVFKFQDMRIELINGTKYDGIDDLDRN